MIPAQHEETFVGKRVTKDLIKELHKAGIKKVTLSENMLVNRVFASGRCR
jgi:hypothetical protein